MQYWKKKKGSKYKYKNKKKHVDKIVEFSNKKLEEYIDKTYSEGVAIHSIVNKRTSSKYLSEVKDYTDANLEDRKNVVTLSRKLRSNEGICSTVVDLLLDFAATNGKFVSDNKDLEKILNTWKDNVNGFETKDSSGAVQPVPGLREVIRKIIDAYLTDGDAVFTLFWSKNKIEIIAGGEKYFLPTNIKVLDSLTLEINKELAQLGIEQITFKISDDLKERILNPKTDADKYLANNVPKDWIKALKNNEDIVLDPSVTFHIKRNARDYLPWGEPLLLKAFTAIANKRRLQAVDESTIDGLINRITVFKLGLPDAEKNKVYHVPSKARVNSLINILTSPKRMNAIVWPGPDLSIEDIGPDGKILEFVEKYQQTDKDILRALHVSPLLIDGGSSGQAARDWASFVSTEVGLDFIRYSLERILTKIGKQIADNNKIDYERLNFLFDTQLLKDEKRVRTFAIKMYELGAISIKTFVEMMGYDYSTEKDRKEEEISNNDSELFVNRSLPYQGNPKSVTNDPGRPANDDVEKKEEVKASIQTDNEDDFENMFYNIYSNIFNKTVNSLKNKKEHKVDIDTVLLSLVSGFAMFKLFVERQLFETVSSIVPFEPNQEEYSYLLAWNAKYIDGFFEDMKSFIQKDINNIDKIIDRYGYRIKLYARETFRKANFIGNLIKAKRLGLNRGLWIATMDDVTCEVCRANNGKKFDVASLRDIFPPHPNCRCNIKFMKD